MSKKLFAVALILGFVIAGFATTVVTNKDAKYDALRQGWVQPADGGVLWSQAPNANTGWYWMYDGNVNTAGTPPFTVPVMPNLPQWYDITGYGANKCAPYNDRPFAYTMTDSFWFYGHWYVPGDELYISPDGWASFDQSVEVDGAPTPPTSVPPIPNVAAPNELFAPLWADYNPTLTPEPSNSNRVFYLDQSVSAQVQGLMIQWNAIRSASGSNTYTFQLGLRTGGQALLDVAGSCGIIFSRHFVHFLYGSAASWTADNARAGIEDQGGTHGIWYQGTISNSRAVRAGYKMIFKHDIAAYTILAPGPVVLRWTKTEPKLVLANLGTEAEHFTASLDIYDDNDAQVYHEVLGSFDLMPNAMDTLVAPCWEPGEIGMTYTKVLGCQLATDECHYNDTIEVESFVHCDDTFRYNWNFGDAEGYGWSVSNQGDAMTWYPCDGGVLMIGARVYLDPDQYGPLHTPGSIEGYMPVAGCGIPQPTAAFSGVLETPKMGWNKAKFGAFGRWVSSSSPGGVFLSLTGAGAMGTMDCAGWYDNYGMTLWPGDHPCYQGPGPGRSFFRHTYFGTPYFEGWGPLCVDDALSYGSLVYGEDYYTTPIEAFVHLGFGPYPLSPKPAPPCYYGEAHDVTAYEITHPDDNWVEAGVAITPEVAIANIGRQAEPSSGFLPVKFFAVTADGDTDYADSALIPKIGYLGDPTDGLDTMYVGQVPWTPEGKCDKYDGNYVVGVEYELIGLVHLGEIGPDESDHCPYNDTVRRNVLSLLTHDAGVVAIELNPPPAPPDIVASGTAETITATVENFGYNQESNVPVRCEILDKGADPDTLVYSNIQLITTLDWRGNTLENPYTADIVFPVWNCPSDNWFTITIRTELSGDMCPDNDFHIQHINSGIEEGLPPLPFALESATPSGVTFTLPATVNVSVKVYDISGKLVTTLVSGSKNAG
ncbi:hypothetical protein GX441_01245, partial [bacterium]|nr:hypothetical protein [bacterium]